MFDLKAIRDDPEAFDRGLARRGLPPRSPEILALDKDWRAAQTKAEQLQAQRNQLAKILGMTKGQMPENLSTLERIVGIALATMKGPDDLKRHLAKMKEDESQLEKEAGARKAEIDSLLATLPNLPSDDVPDGRDERDNQQIREFGTPKRFDFKAKDHVALGEGLKQMDFARAGKLSGARFVVLSGGLARLERALGAFMLDLHTREFGYTEVAPPLLVRDEAAFGTGQLPKFADDLFRTTTGLWLIPTAEVPLTNLVAGEILDEPALPLRFTAWTPCFRSEAGAAGKDTRGMIRQHQFNKVELVSIAHPDAAGQEHEHMTACAEEVLKRLDLPYRVMLLCAGDMGAAARKTYDIEVWLPGQNAYREISSCSQCGEYQARRMNARFKPKEGPKKGGGGNRFVHTLNGSGLAVGRAMIAVLENHQQEDGSIAIPPALRPYMGGLEVLRRDG